MSARNRLEHTFSSTKGVRIRVKPVFKGQGFGVNDSVVHKEDMPLIEFYFLPSRDHGNSFFISRYYVSAFTCRMNEPMVGLCLDGANSAFDLSAEDVRGVLSFIAEQVVPLIVEKQGLLPVDEQALLGQAAAFNNLSLNAI